jgi:hypothetical protein
MLTKTQQNAVRYAAAQKGDVILYRETSLSGLSETLRYRRRWTEAGRWGPTPRQETGMILSVAINVLPNGRDDPDSIEKYNHKCEEAERLFKELRR